MERLLKDSNIAAAVAAYGFDPSEQSYTQWEAWIALAHGKKLLVYAREEREEAVVGDSAQHRHARALASHDHYPNKFGNLDQLLKLVALALLGEKNAPSSAAALQFTERPSITKKVTPRQIQERAKLYAGILQVASGSPPEATLEDVLNRSYAVPEPQTFPRVTRPGALWLEAKFYFDLTSDQSSRALNSPKAFEDAYKRVAPSEERTKEHGYFARGYIPNSALRNGYKPFDANSPEMDQVRELIEALGKTPIFCCPVMQPAICACLLHLAYTFGIPRESVDIYAWNGSAMYRQHASRTPPISIVANSAAMYRTSRFEDSGLELNLLLHRTEQRLLRRADSMTADLKTVFFGLGTSSEEQARNRIGLDCGIQHYVGCTVDELFQRAQFLEPEEAIIAWEPAARGMIRRSQRGRQIVSVPNQTYRYDVGVQFAKRQIPGFDMERIQNTLLDLVFFSWRDILCDPGRGLALLLNDPHLVREFQGASTWE